MNATCTECGSVFRVDPARVPADGVRARCSVCGGVFAVDGERAQDGRAGSRALVDVPVATPDGSAGAPPLASIWGAPEAIPAVRHAPVEDGGETLAAPSPVIATSAGGEAETATGPGTAAFVPVAETPGESLEPRAPLAPVAQPPHAPPAPAVAAVPAPAATRRPVNPYLANDPGARARRLARALVSDLVAYHPAKREEGLRDGTLKQLFRDEIRKSWDEYVEQIGAPLAEGTTHFQDALNDILAGGRKVF